MTASSDRNTHDQTERLPGTVFTPRQVRMLKIAVAVMGLALVGGFALVLGTIVYQASHLDKSASPGPRARAAETALRLAPGERIDHMALDGGRLAVHLTGPAGPEIRVIDLATGEVVARVRVKSE